MINELKEKVTIIGIVPLNFKSDDGNEIKGFTIHAFRDKKDSENVIGKSYEKIFLKSDNVEEDTKKYALKTYPLPCVIEFEIVSLKSKPKAKKLIF